MLKLDKSWVRTKFQEGNPHSDLPDNWEQTLDNWHRDENHPKYGEWIPYWKPWDKLEVV